MSAAGLITLTDAERQAVAAELRRDHNMHDVSYTIERVVGAINAFRRRPRSEADHLDLRKVRG